MMKTTFTAKDRTRSIFAVMMALLLGLVAALPAFAHDDATPPSTRSCEDFAATPPMRGMPMDDAGMMGATPSADAMGESPEFDLAYIDMMIPHHESVIALAEVALPELDDPRLVEIAEAIPPTVD